MTLGHFTLVEVEGFLDGEDADWNPSGVKRRRQLHMGSESQMRIQLAEEARRLREDGFTLCSVAPDEQGAINSGREVGSAANIRSRQL